MSRLIDADAVKESIKKQVDILRLIGNDEVMQYADIIQRGFFQEIDNAPTIEPQKWILCSEMMPEEHDSIFSKFYGTEKWRDAMFRKSSKTVIITVEHLDGTRQTAPCHTIDGEWNQSMKGMGKVLAWMPLPEPWKGEEE